MIIKLINYLNILKTFREDFLPQLYGVRHVQLWKKFYLNGYNHTSFFRPSRIHNTRRTKFQTIQNPHPWLIYEKDRNDVYIKIHLFAVRRSSRNIETEKNQWIISSLFDYMSVLYSYFIRDKIKLLLFNQSNILILSQ